MAKLEISIGFKVDREYDAQLDQALAITGEDRATFVREAVRFAMTRTIKGSDPSDSEPEPTAQFSFEDAAATIRWLEQTLIDFKQVAGEHQRQSANLRKLERDDANAMHRARAEFLEGYPERIMKSQKPVHDKLTELSGKMDDLPGVADIFGGRDTDRGGGCCRIGEHGGSRPKGPQDGSRRSQGNTCPDREGNGGAAYAKHD
ncbi:hypothetical protein NPJ82_17940 (plasmid) [Sphingomonas sp. NY01]|uniref:hypothetical protein n=1 Tax=Sphingomonas sp. NY01 TaxID=2968057 RepID=UPI00315DDBB2